MEGRQELRVNKDFCRLQKEKKTQQKEDATGKGQEKGEGIPRPE